MTDIRRSARAAAEGVAAATAPSTRQRMGSLRKHRTIIVAHNVKEGAAKAASAFQLLQRRYRAGRELPSKIKLGSCRPSFPSWRKTCTSSGRSRLSLLLLCSVL
jgi:hypothetical protein